MTAVRTCQNGFNLHFGTSGEQVRAGLYELQIGAALVLQSQPRAIALKVSSWRRGRQLADFLVVETRYTLQILAVHNMAQPKDFLGPEFRSLGFHQTVRLADEIDLDPGWRGSTSRRIPRTFRSGDHLVSDDFGLRQH